RGRRNAAKNLDGTRFEALIRLGRVDEALALSRAGKERSSEEHDRVSCAQNCAYALAIQGKNDEALLELPSFEHVLPTHSLYERWSQATFTLAMASAIPNTWKLDAQLFDMQRRLHENGVLRLTADMAERRARLAIARGRLATAAECIRE